ncbi:MAG: hypothetical protein ACTSU9_15440 [Promethearchaeota archaeon]
MKGGSCVFSSSFLLLVVFLSITGAQATGGGFDTSGAIPIDDQFCLSHARTRQPEFADIVQELGVTMVRNNIMWNQAEEPYGSNNYTWDYYDNMYSNESARGMESLGLFIFGRGGWPDSNYIGPSEYPEWLMFVEAFVNRYKDNITYYEIWNEPDIGFWNGTDDEFFFFMNMTLQKVLELDNTSILVSPGVSGPNVEYIEKMITWFGDAEFNNLFDVMAFHAYPNHNPEHLSYRLQEVKEVARKHGFTGELWITEVGFTTSVAVEEQLDNGFVEELREQQAEQVLKYYCQCIDENISSIFWYTLSDWCGDVYDGEGWFGLITCDYWDVDHWNYKYKPAGHAYNLLSHVLDGGSIYYPRGSVVNAPVKDNIWNYHFYTADNTSLLVLWGQSSATKVTITLKTPSGATKRPSFNVREWDYKSYMYDDTENITEFKTRLGYTPIVIELDYSTYLQDEILASEPLTIVIGVRYDLASIAFIIATLALSAMSIGIAWQRTREASASSVSGASNPAPRKTEDDMQC